MRHQAPGPASADIAETAADADLVDAALAGRREAFDVLAMRYQERLFNTLAPVVGSREDAADAVQDALVQAYLKLASFRGASQFYTWLYRIAMNMALSRRRRRPTASVDAMRDGQGEQPVDHRAGAEATALAREQVSLVRTALAHLGEQQRKILVLRELEDCSYEQIAEILELPVGTVRSRLFRARLQLRDQLQALNDEKSDKTRI